MKKKLLPIIMILILLMTAPVQAFAAKTDLPDMETGLKYLNIGDSIAVGLSADDGYSYFELYADYLDDNYGMEETWVLPFVFPGFAENSRPGAINLSVEGLDSMELLGALASSPQFQKFVAEADVITISIGGNNLLTPVIGTVAGLYGIDNPSSFESSESFMVELLGRIARYGDEAWEENLTTFTASALNSEAGTLGWALEYGSAQFLSDWPVILDAIEMLNPDAHIIALTIYNPIEKDDSKDLYHRYEKLVRPMNIAIMKTQNRAMVAKVEKAFAKEPEAVAFKLTWMEGLLPVWLDPHPTTLGHGIIFEELINQRNPKSIY